MLWDRTPADLAALGYPRDATELFARIMRVDRWDAHGPALGREARRFCAPLDASLPRIVREERSSDGATKLVLEVDDGRFEAVHMPRDARRVTVCLSSQIGCAMGCTFCATARLGLERHLTAGEIVAQLMVVLHRLGPPDPAARVSLVFMGMGEPLQDVDALARALDVITHPAGLSIPPSRITVSTVGHVPGIARLARIARRPRLAVSVNAALEPLRRSLMPVTKRWPLDALRDALIAWPRAPHEKIALEYVLLRDVNTDTRAATHLASWLRQLDTPGPRRLVLDLIPFNPWPGAPYAPPPEATVTSFAATVRSLAPRIIVTRRTSRGPDIHAACGTLHAALPPGPGHPEAGPGHPSPPSNIAVLG